MPERGRKDTLLSPNAAVAPASPTTEVQELFCHTTPKRGRVCVVVWGSSSSQPLMQACSPHRE